MYPHFHLSITTLQRTLQHKKKNHITKMVRFSSFLKVFTAITLVFLFFQTGSSRELAMKSSNGVDHFASTTYQVSRKMMHLDYGDPEANTNERSGLNQPDHHSPDPPTPDHD